LGLGLGFERDHDDGDYDDTFKKHEVAFNKKHEVGSRRSGSPVVVVVLLLPLLGGTHADSAGLRAPAVHSLLYLLLVYPSGPNIITHTKNNNKTDDGLWDEAAPVLVGSDGGSGEVDYHGDDGFFCVVFCWRSC